MVEKIVRWILSILPRCNKLQVPQYYSHKSQKKLEAHNVADIIQLRIKSEELRNMQLKNLYKYSE